MARLRSLPRRAKLSCHHLRLSFRVERNAKDRFALIAQELQNGQRSLRSFIASSQRFDDNVRGCFALRTFATHGRLLFGILEDGVGSGTAQS